MQNDTEIDPGFVFDLALIVVARVFPREVPAKRRERLEPQRHVLPVVLELLASLR
jgi:hypothetical protein